MFASGLFSLFGFPLIHDPCCKISSCSAGMCCIRSITLSSQHYFSGFQGLPASWELWMNLKVRLHSLWLLRSVASTALENKLILTGAISSENDSGGVWEFSSLHKSVLSHFYFNGCWFNLTFHHMMKLWFFRLLRAWWQRFPFLFFRNVDTSLCLGHFCAFCFA